MKATLHILLFGLVCALLGACGSPYSGSEGAAAESPPEAADFERGPHGGRMLRDGVFAVELAIFETGVPPEFRAWITSGGKPVDPAELKLTVQLTRLGDRVDKISFEPADDYLRGDTVVYEPHSFVVSVEATQDGASHRFEYDNFEGRTRISAAMAKAFDLETSVAGPAVLQEVVETYGRIEPNAERVRDISARFDGVIRSVDVALGAVVQAGQRLATIESNESLKPYSIAAPIDGVITVRHANPGEQTDGRVLFTIMDSSSVWVNLAIFPSARDRVQEGASVTVTTAVSGRTSVGTIDRIDIVAAANQAMTARVVLDNAEDQFPPGAYVSARIEVAEYSVPLAVKRTGLQSFRDFTVVYAQIGDEYEVRMLDLGRQDDQWVEVLGGLEPGTRYVTDNSYLVKADIEKSGASHDH